MQNSLLQSGDDLSALFVIDDGIDVNDLGADGDFLSFLRFAS